MEGAKNKYCVVLKYPAPGTVKTRLARDIGPLNAVSVYLEITQRVLRQTQPQNAEYERTIFFSPADMRNRFEEWVPGERLSAQRGGDIGEIMCNAFRDLFDSGASKVVITGIDIPELGRRIIVDAFSGLDRADVVIGPAMDGGYYLIGMKVLQPALFQGISWGTEMVFQETVSLIEGLGLTFQTLAALSDLDTFEDLKRFRNPIF